jgi:hypothetical protein
MNDKRHANGNTSDRRTGEDRRRHSRNGRRRRDPHTAWRRAAMLFGLYAAYLSVRSIPNTMRRFWRRQGA